MTDKPKLSKSARRRRNKRLRQQAEAPSNEAPVVALADDGGIEGAAEAILKKYLKARHRPCFNLMAQNMGVSASELIGIMVRNATIRELPNYREATGAGGASSKDIEALSERLPRK